MKNYIIKPLHHVSIVFFCLFIFVVSASAIDNFPRDISFNSNTVTSNSTTYSVEVIQSGSNAGKIMMGGEFNTYNNLWWPTNYPKIVRLNSDGTLDKTFRAAAFDNGSSVYAIAIQPDGKVLVGGVFSVTASGKTYTNVVRLDESGNIDPTFNPLGGGTAGDNGTGWVKDIVISKGPDGLPKIWIGGRFESYNGTRVVSAAGRNGGLIIANLNGTIYANPMVEDAPGSTGGGIENMYVTASGQVLLGGEFGRIGIGGGNFTYARRVARMNSNGTFDNSFFQTSGGVDKYVGPGGTVYSITEQILPSGEHKILIGGGFTSFNDITVGVNFTSGVSRIVRLNTDGSLDKAFQLNTGSGLNSNQVWALLPDAQGRVIIAGGFTSYNGNPVNRVVRLLPDGTYDANFNIGDGFAATSTNSNPVIYDLAFQANMVGSPEGYVLAAGNFDYFNGSKQQSNGIRMVNEGAVILASNAIHFSVKKQDAMAVIAIQATGNSNAIYELQQSIDGKIFKPIKVFTSQEMEAGISYKDPLTVSGKIYYRVLITARNATNELAYSSVLSVINTATYSAKITRISNGQLKVSVSSSNDKEVFDLTIVTLTGQLIYRQELRKSGRELEQLVQLNSTATNSLVVLTSKEQKEPLQKLLLK